MFRSYLYTDKLEYVRRNPAKECFFCSQAKAKTDAKSKKLYHKNGMMLMTNAFPYTTGHLMVVPERHVTKMEQLTENEHHEMWSLVRKTVKLLGKTYDPPGFNIGINVGGNLSGGSIKHLHMHVVPRYEKDNGVMESIFHTKVMPELLENTYKTLRKNVSILG